MFQSCVWLAVIISFLGDNLYGFQLLEVVYLWEKMEFDLDESYKTKFIYASSSSVYGIKKELNVTEEMKLEPLTDYSKFKAQCEEILQKYTSNSFHTCTLRPATVCGYSPRQRLDVVVNILTTLAYYKGEIKILAKNT